MGTAEGGEGEEEEELPAHGARLPALAGREKSVE
jgi:hypothetical protein